MKLNIISQLVENKIQIQRKKDKEDEEKYMAQKKEKQRQEKTFILKGKTQ